MNFSPIVKEREFIKGITPALRHQKGSDFASWQVEARAKLAELLGLSLMAPFTPSVEIVSSDDKADYREFIIKVETEKDYYLTATLRMPATSADKAPLVIFPIGHSDDFAALLDSGAVSDAIKAGYAALVVEQRNFDGCNAILDTISEEGAKRVTWHPCYRSSMRAAMLGRTTMGERVWDLMRVLDVVLARYDSIDSNKVAIVGNSGGATLAYYTACIDERISAVVASSGFCSFEKSIMQRHHCVCNYIPYIANYFELGDLAGLIAPRALVIVAPKNDEWFPVDGAEDAFALAKAAYADSSRPEALKLYTPDGERGFYSQIAFEELAKAFV